MNVLVTGASGFSGTHLLQLLQAEKVSLFTHGPIKGIWGKNYDTPIHDLQALVRVINDVQPDYVLHLAGIAASDRYSDFYSVNVLYAANLLQALEVAGRGESPVLLVGTSAEYGLVGPDQLPIREETPPRPYNHYGVSKLAQTLMGQTQARTGRKLIMVRPSNIIGPGMGDHLSVKRFARQMAEIALGLKPTVVTVGNLSSFRDFVDVKEVVDIYWKLIQTPPAYGQIINICSGRATKMEDLLRTLIGFSGRSVEIRTEPTLFKSIDLPVHYGSTDKLYSILGLIPTKNLAVTLKEIFDDLLKQLQRSTPEITTVGKG
jgi:GDP-4-dehydro-6-deoxy-D-mannose reductase